MTRFLFTLLLLIGASTLLRAQLLVPFPDSAVKWINVWYSWDGPGSGGPANYFMADAEEYTMNGQDTLIDTLSYTLLQRDGLYAGAIRDDSGQVYFYPKDSSQEYLIYDFTLEKNDTTIVYVSRFSPVTDGFSNIMQAVILNTDSVMVDGHYRKSMFVKYSTGSVGQWTAGVGEKDGFICPEGISVTNRQATLYCMTIEDTLQFPGNGPSTCLIPADVGIEEEEIESRLKVYPNPASEVLHIDFDQRDYSIDLIGINGQHVFCMDQLSGPTRLPISNLASGMYTLRVRLPDDRLPLRRIILLK